MSDNSAIQWTDATWNPTTGCTKHSPGCAHCYIERTPPFRIAGRRFERGHIPLQLHQERLFKPLEWQRPRHIFVDSLSDLFHRDVLDQFIVDVFGVMWLAYWHRFQVLTKREDRLLEFLTGDPGIVAQFRALAQVGGVSSRAVFRALDRRRRDRVPFAWPPPNIRVGVSVENQPFGDRRFPIICELGEAGWNTMVSLEPLLGPVIVPDRYLALGSRAWCVAGGESGNGARPCDLAWIRSIVTQCKSANVACFVKQLGARPRVARATLAAGRTPVECAHGFDVCPRCDAGFHEYKFRDAKGGEISEWPTDLRVREFPKVETTTSRS